MIGDGVTRLADEALASPLARRILAAGLRCALDAKRRLDWGVEALLGLLNLPSRTDLQRLHTKLDVLQGTLTNVSMKVDRLLDRQPPAATAPAAGGPEEPRR